MTHTTFKLLYHVIQPPLDFRCFHTSKQRAVLWHYPRYLYLLFRCNVINSFINSPITVVRPILLPSFIIIVTTTTMFNNVRTRPASSFSTALKPRMDSLLLPGSPPAPATVGRFRVLRAILFIIFTVTSFILLHVILVRTGIFALPLPFSQLLAHHHHTLSVPGTTLSSRPIIQHRFTATTHPTASSTQQHQQQQQQPYLNQTRALEISKHDRHMVYIPSADVLLVTMAKAGSSTLYHWLYRGLTGLSGWDSTSCGGSHIHDKRSRCWKKVAMPLFSFTPSEQAAILFSSSSHTMRIAIQRNPFERLISAFKSKFTCQHDHFNTDVHERQKMVNGLLQSKAHNKTCLTISEFAQALKTFQETNPNALDSLDDHIKPQQFYFDDIDYDMILDVNHLSDISVLKPLVERLPYKHLAIVRHGLRKRHESGDQPLHIPDDAAAKLYAFALESKPGPVRFMSKEAMVEINAKERSQVLKHLYTNEPAANA